MKAVSLARKLRELADDEYVIYVLHLLIEDELVSRRDARVSSPYRCNGLVIRERDGTNSSAIRIPTDEAVQRVIRGLADYVEKKGN
jgi:hypothetical protein